MRARQRPEERMDMPQKPLPEGIVALDELEILVVVDNETDTLSSVDEGVPQIPEVVHLAARLPPSRKYDGHECKTVFDQLCCACHGLSVLITGRSGGQRHRLLFDVGPYPDLWLENARRLAIDLSTIEYILLSHWHFDHSGGLPRGHRRDWQGAVGGGPRATVRRSPPRSSGPTGHPVGRRADDNVAARADLRRHRASRR